MLGVTIMQKSKFSINLHDPWVSCGAGLRENPMEIHQSKFSVNKKMKDFEYFYFFPLNSMQFYFIFLFFFLKLFESYDFFHVLSTRNLGLGAFKV